MDLDFDPVPLALYWHDVASTSWADDVEREMTTRLRQLGVPEATIPAIVAEPRH